MPFPKLRTVQSITGGGVFLPELVTTNKTIDGEDVQESHVDLVNQCKSMPSMDEFYIKNQLKVGVPLKQVSGIMFSADEFPVTLEESKPDTKSDTKPDTKSDTKPDTKSE